MEFIVEMTPKEKEVILRLKSLMDNQSCILSDDFVKEAECIICADSRKEKALEAQAKEIFDRMNEKIRAFTLKRTGQQEVRMMMIDLKEEYRKKFGVDE